MSQLTTLRRYEQVMAEGAELLGTDRPPR